MGSSTFHLQHEKGETDDATVTWLAEKSVLCSGDLFIWNSPNAGNPRRCSATPSNGRRPFDAWPPSRRSIYCPVTVCPSSVEIASIRRSSETAEYLESLVDSDPRVDERRSSSDDTISSVRAPSHLTDRPYLQPFYDEPEFIVRNIWRLYGGWWDGNPANLRPANDRRVASELCALAGGSFALASRAEALLEDGDDEALRLAGHFAEMAWLATPDDVGVQGVRQRVFDAVSGERHLHDVARRLSLGRTRDDRRSVLESRLTDVKTRRRHARANSSYHKI